MKTLITMGDPAGIGPEIILKALNCLENIENICIIGNREIFNKAESETLMCLPEDCCFIDVPFDDTTICSKKESKASGELSFLCLKKACEIVENEKINAIVTAPISKNAINLAGHNFSGQTEILEKYLSDSKKNKAEMLFAADDFRVLLLTRHIALKNVSLNLDQEKIVSSIKILNNALKENFNISNPKIAICGMNPHAGEGGLLGKEEQETIIPAIKTLKNKNINIDGPFPADTLFYKAGQKYLSGDHQEYDCFVACYHDQGLIPIKIVAMNKTVNITIGLPILRTSPAHGTAFDIAGENIADHKSMLEALKMVL